MAAVNALKVTVPKLMRLLLKLWDNIQGMDMNGNGVIEHDETTAAIVRGIESMSGTIGGIKWEGKLKTEDGREEFAEELIALYQKYTKNE